VVTRTEYARRPRVLFVNYIEAARGTVIKDLKPETGAALGHKYKGIRLYDGEDFETYRVEIAPSSLARRAGAAL
jgi:hypothetical protein